MKVKYFFNKVEFRQKVKVMSAKPVEVKGVVEYMCCDDETTMNIIYSHRSTIIRQLADGSSIEYL